MSNHATHPGLAEGQKTEKLSLMYFGKRRCHPTTVFSLVGILAVFLFIMTGYLGIKYRTAQIHPPALSEKSAPVPLPAFNESGPTAKLIQKLKQYGLWALSPMQKVPRFFLKAYPADLHTVRDVSVKKRIFLHTLLPHALLVRQEVSQKRDRLVAILDRIDCKEGGIRDIDFRFEYENQCSWTGKLPEDDVRFIRNLSREYRATSIETLLERVDTVPVSIILAQGALE